jgi:shikimate kinase
MVVDLTTPNQIILIGPVGTGKTTIGMLLAEHLHASFTSLDTVEHPYMLAAGYDLVHANALRQSPAPFARYQYRRMFFDAAVIGFLSDHQHGVLELGAGHPIVPDREKQARIIQALHPYPRVVLLLPVPALREAVQRLRARRGVPDHDPDINDLFIADDTFYSLAKYSIYTEGKSPEESCTDVLTALDLP